MRWQTVLGVIVLLFGYVVMGGLVFWRLEATKDRPDEKLRLPGTSPTTGQLQTVDSAYKELISRLVQQIDDTLPTRGLIRSVASIQIYFEGAKFFPHREDGNEARGPKGQERGWGSWELAASPLPKG